MTKCQAEGIECFNTARWQVKYRVSYLGERNKFKKKICNQCYNQMNPEHKKKYLYNGNPELKQAMRDVCEIVGLNMDGWIESPMLVTFRPL